MLTAIEDEIKHMVDFLSHCCGFEVSLYTSLQIRPIDEGAPPTEWEVSWKETIDGVEFESYKEFTSLQEAAQFFVEKRRYMCLGADFESILNESTEVIAEIKDE